MIHNNITGVSSTHHSGSLSKGADVISSVSEQNRKDCCYSVFSNATEHLMEEEMKESEQDEVKDVEQQRFEEDMSSSSIGKISSSQSSRLFGSSKKNKTAQVNYSGLDQHEQCMKNNL